jgi:ribosomal protein S18 acetylase RimI-like enzyme
MEALRKHVNEEASDELVGVERHGGIARRTLDAVMRAPSCRANVGLHRSAIGASDTMMPVAEAWTVVIPLTSGDFASLAALAIELAAHHGDRYSPAPSALKNDYGDWYQARLARTARRQDIGFVTWQRFYVSECAERGMEIRNLYVRADVRGRGIGRQLLRAAAREALLADCQRLRLGVRKDNAVGVQFYKQFGCVMSDKGMSWGCRWSRDGIFELAEGK